jgi:UDP-N-acetylenolpyruvoylglucosamine reductase
MTRERCYGPTMSHSKEKRREEIKKKTKKKTTKQLERTKAIGLIFKNPRSKYFIVILT